MHDILNSKKMRVFLIFVSLVTLAAQDAPKRPVIPAPMKITIPAFPDGGLIPAKYANMPAGSMSPAIEWSEVPQAALTIALILHDADVPFPLAAAGSGTGDILHWAIFKIPAKSAGLPEAVPHDLMLEDGSVQFKYAEGVPRLAIGKIGYFGPSPPPTPAPVPHHYVFDFYALDSKLDPALNSREDLIKAMAGHVLAKGVYFGIYANSSAPR